MTARTKTATALFLENRRLLAEVERLRELLKDHLQNGVIHYKDAFGKCFLVCVGCPLEEETKEALAAVKEGSHDKP